MLFNHLGVRWALLPVLLITTMAQAQSRTRYQKAREQMVREAIIAAGVKDQRVIRSMLQTPRHEFVGLNLRSQAYFDMALPIGDKQTISSPFIVAYMTQSLDPQPADKVLEIGTGSGYQAAVLSPLVQSVYSIEIVESLGRRAAQTLKRLRYTNVKTKVGDGFKGWREHAPFDKIIVTCSPERVPKPLVEQLREGGLMVVPVGQRYQQTLYLFRKRNGELKAEALRPTLFVPMTGTAEDGRQVKPDPRMPAVVNGNFERDSERKDEFFPGWYYQRQAGLVSDGSAPQGEKFVRFANREPGRASHALQGFAIDGKSIREISLSGWVRYENVFPGRNADESSMIALTFYDANRKDLGSVRIGPFRGSEKWHQQKKLIRVPALAREGILRIGLFGATGELSIDQLQMQIEANR